KAKRNISLLADTPEEHRDNLLYLFRFVFQFANNYETLEEALAHKDDEEMHVLRNLALNYPRAREYDRKKVPHGIYLVGLENDIIISDMSVILTIVYNKWDFEQPSDYLKIFEAVQKAPNKKKSKARKKEFDRINAFVAEHSSVTLKE
nr:hypothetical protein [Lachnospira sp.]